MGKIIWTEKASAHLKAIHDYIAEDSSVYAVRFVKALVKATLKLETFPMAGRLVPEFEGTSTHISHAAHFCANTKACSISVAALPYATLES